MAITLLEFMALPKPEAETSIYIMRHGRTALDDIYRSDGWLDYPLSDQGRMRLITAQQYLKDVPIRRIFAPKLKRTVETAEIMQSGIISHPDIEIAEAVKTWNLGTLMGTPKKPNKPVVQYFMEHPSEKPAGGESMFEFRARFLPFLAELRKEILEDDGGPVLIVTSGSNLREISFQLTGNKDTFDLDEGGLMVMHPISPNEWGANLVFGHKSSDNQWLS